MNLLIGHDEAVINWVVNRLPFHRGNTGTEPFGPCRAIGVVSTEGRIAAGVIFNDYHPEFKTIQATVAAETPRWATHRLLREIFSYPFLQLGCNVVWAAIEHDNQRAIRFVKGIGFVQEGVGRFRFGKKHAVVCSMTAKEFRKKYLRDAGRREAA